MRGGVVIIYIQQKNLLWDEAIYYFLFSKMYAIYSNYIGKKSLKLIFVKISFKSSAVCESGVFCFIHNSFFGAEKSYLVTLL